MGALPVSGLIHNRAENWMRSWEAGSGQRPWITGVVTWKGASFSLTPPFALRFLAARPFRHPLPALESLRYRLNSLTTVSQNKPIL